MSCKVFSIANSLTTLSVTLPLTSPSQLFSTWRIRYLVSNMVWRKGLIKESRNSNKIFPSECVRVCVWERENTIRIWVANSALLIARFITWVFKYRLYHENICAHATHIISPRYMKWLCTCTAYKMITQIWNVFIYLNLQRVGALFLLLSLSLSLIGM